MISITYAQKIIENQLSQDDLKSINQEILTKTKEKETSDTSNRTSSYASMIKKLRILEELLDKNLTTPCKINSMSSNENSLKSHPLVFAISEALNKSLSIENFSGLFIDCLQLFPNLDNKVMKTIKIFSQEYKINSNKQLEKISKIAFNFYLLWKKIKISDELKKERSFNVANIKLRKHACRKFSSILEAKLIDKKQAQIKGIILEKSIREKYPDMGQEYIKECKILIKSLKESDPQTQTSK